MLKSSQCSNFIFLCQAEDFSVPTCIQVISCQDGLKIMNVKKKKKRKVYSESKTFILSNNKLLL